MHKNLAYNKTIIHYNIEGNGIPVILVHGFGEDATVWNYQADFLKQHCLVISIDLPGSGKSIFTEQVDSFKNEAATIEFYTDCIYAVVGNEKLTECILLGHSMGGYITLAFAEKYPEKVKGFGLVHSTAFADNEEKKAARKKGIEIIGEYGSYSFLKNTTPNLFASGFKKENADRINELIEQGKKFLPVTLQQYYTAMMNRPDRTNVLKDSKVPVLFVAGTEDVAAPLTDVLQQVHFPETAYIHIFEDTGHMGMWENTKGTNEALLSFITNISVQ